MRKFSGISRNVTVLGLVSLLQDASSEMLYPVVPVFLAGVLGAPITVIGLIVGKQLLKPCAEKLFCPLRKKHAATTPSRRLRENFVRDLTCNFRLTFLNFYIGL